MNRHPLSRRRGAGRSRAVIDSAALLKALKTQVLDWRTTCARE